MMTLDLAKTPAGRAFHCAAMDRNLSRCALAHFGRTKCVRRAGKCRAAMRTVTTHKDSSNLKFQADAVACETASTWLAQVIPPLLHQTWTSQKPLPGILRSLSSQWDAELPTFQHILWDQNANEKLWRQHAPELFAVYQRYDTDIERADASRLLYLAVHGGVYADLDAVPCTRSALQNALRNSLLFLVRDPWRGTAERKRIQHVSNFFMASVRGHPFWRFALQGLASHQGHRGGIMHSTGPVSWQSRTRHFSSSLPEASYDRLSALAVLRRCYVEAVRPRPRTL